MQDARAQSAEPGAVHPMVSLASFLGLAIILLDGGDRVTFVNERAQRLLGAFDGVAIRADSLVASTPSDRRRLAAALASLGTAGAGERQLLAIHSAATDRPVFLMVFAMTMQDAGRKVVVLSDPFSTDRLCSQCLRQLFSLTPREAELAVHLAVGRSLPEAAETLAMSMGTARAHLRHVFQKTGCDSQARLAVLLNAAAFGPCPPPLRATSAAGSV